MAAPSSPDVLWLRTTETRVCHAWVAPRPPETWVSWRSRCGCARIAPGVGPGAGARVFRPWHKHAPAAAWRRAVFDERVHVDLKAKKCGACTRLLRADANKNKKSTKRKIS